MATWKVSYGRYVQLHVTATEIDVDVANNRSKVRVQSSIYYPGGTSARNAYPQTLSVNVNGTNIGTQNSITYSLSTSNRTRTLTTYTSGYITHNADGSKSVNINVSITDGAGDNGRVNQTLRLTTIARASSLTSFSIGSLKNGTAKNISLNISRQNSSFKHDIQLRDGGTVLKSWNGQDTPTSLPLTATNVNTILNRMPNTTSKTLTLRVQTKSGSTNIGSALTRNATATVHADVKPTVSAMTVNISGKGRDNDISKYVQGFTRVAAKFTPTAVGGASITSSSIVVRRRSGAADSQTINSNDGTTGRAVALSGLYEIRGTTRDSRGRTTNTAWATITVDAYSAPRITKFDVVREIETATTANASITGGHSHLGGQNPLTLKLEKRLSTGGAWTNVPLNTTATSTTATFSRTAVDTGNSVTRSYDFRLSLSDTFGAKVEATRTVSTQRVVLDIHKNEGVGIGKIHEKGVLDVDGRAYFKGDLFVNDVNVSSAQPFVAANHGTTVEDTSEFWQNLPQGSYYVYGNQIPNQPSLYGIMVHTTQSIGSGSDYNTMWYEQSYGMVYRKSGNRTNNTSWVPLTIARKSNSNGYWVEFPDGTLFAQGEADIPRTGDQTLRGFPIVPHSSRGIDAGGVTVRGANYTHMRDFWKMDYAFYGNGIRFFRSVNSPWEATGNIPITYWYIGRWKE